MTTAAPLTPQQAVDNARAAFQRDDKRAVRYWAELAARMDPTLEDPWLLLAAVSSPHASLLFLERALQAHPESQRARQGLQWAQQRVQAAATQPLAVSQTPPATTQPARVAMVTQPVKPVAAPAHQTQPVRTVRIIARQKTTTRAPLPAFLLLVLGVCALLLVFLTLDTIPARAFINSLSGPQGGAASWAPAVLSKPTLTPLPSATSSPTLMAAETVTVTLIAPTAELATALPTEPPTSLPTETEQPSPTPLPTDTLPSPASGPVYTVQSGDTLSSIAQRLGMDLNTLASANNLSVDSPVAVGQVLTVPVGAVVPPALTYSAKHILVDISEQHLYAYEGETLVFSFVASTGMNGATRVGTFSVLDKIPNAYGSTWDIWMPDWLGIYYSGSLENGIHSLPILPNGARLWAGYLGTPISYGCVVLGVDESRLLYDWAEVGTLVQIQY